MLKLKKLPLGVPVGVVVAGFISLFILLAFGALLVSAPQVNIGQVWHDPYYRHVTLFSFWQAILSTVISLGLALPVAHALSRRRFRGRGLLLKLFSATLVLPVLVGVFGILAVYGNSGLLAQMLSAFAIQPSFSIYGLSGILLAHVFFNLPYASRLLLQALDGIAAEQHKLCTHLGMSPWQKFVWIEWPVLRQQLPHVAGLVFMLCFTSFTIVMSLGGGPRATTIELAIYQAIKFDFDLGTGALLALWQVVLCALLALSLQWLTKPLAVSFSDSAAASPMFNDTRSSLWWDRFWIGIALLLVVPPLLLTLYAGLNGKFWSVMQDTLFWHSAWASLRVAVCSALIAVFAGIAIVTTSRVWRLRGWKLRASQLEIVGTIILVTPGLVISTGLFLLLRRVTDVFSMALLVVIVVNSLMALPYVIKILVQPMLHLEQKYHYLCSSLGIKGWQRFKVVEWRALHASIAQAFAISFMLSVGDLSAIALFGSQDFQTLPLYLYQLLGSYQMDSAAVVALLLLLLSLTCFTLCERLSGVKKKIHVNP